jgi:signal transduction histidine kinase
VFAATVERAERAERDRESEARRRVDAERLRIARELHDVVAHTMSMINVQAGVASHVIATHPQQAVVALSAIKEASREGLHELRSILNVLRSVDEDDAKRVPAPKLAQLDDLADAVSQAGVATTLTVAGRRDARLPPAVELTAYRIVQESLTNVLRHAGPHAEATVRVLVGRRKLLVIVDDDGPERSAARVAVRTDRDEEFPGEFAIDGTGSGLVGMRERVAAVGGKVRVGPRPGNSGWRVFAVLPLTDVDGTEQLSPVENAPDAPDASRPSATP